MAYLLGEIMKEPQSENLCIWNEEIFLQTNIFEINKLEVHILLQTTKVREILKEVYSKLNKYGFN